MTTTHCTICSTAVNDALTHESRYHDGAQTCWPKSPLERLEAILDKLDTEDDDRVRADLIDEAIELADSDAAAAAEWKAYR